MMKIISLIFLLVGTSGSRFDTELQRYLELKLSSYHSFDFEIIQMPKGNGRIKILNEKELNINGNMAYIPVEIYSDGNSVSNTYISIKLKLMNNVLVARKNLEYNSKLNESMIEIKLMDIAKLRGNPVVDVSEVSKYRCNRKLNAGSILVYENLEKIPDVIAGASLNAISMVGNVAVSTKAFAREDGNIGDAIKIRTVDNIIFVAKIIDLSQVLILE